MPVIFNDFAETICVCACVYHQFFLRLANKATTKAVEESKCEVRNIHENFPLGRRH
jgi:hypothetical protein